MTQQVMAPLPPLRPGDVRRARAGLASDRKRAAKEPAERFATAAEFAQRSKGAAASPTGARPHGAPHGRPLLRGRCRRGAALAVRPRPSEPGRAGARDARGSPSSRSRTWAPPRTATSPTASPRRSPAGWPGCPASASSPAPAPTSTGRARSRSRRSGGSSAWSTSSRAACGGSGSAGVEPGAGHPAAHPGVRRPPPLGRAVRRELEEVFEVQSRIAEQVAARWTWRSRQPDHEALAAKPTERPPRLRFLPPRATTTSIGRHPRGEPRGGGDVHQGHGARSGLRARLRPARPEPHLAVPLLGADRRPGSPWHGAPPIRRCGSSPISPEAHLALGQIHYWGELDYEAALREFRTAHAGDPGNGDLAWARGLVERRLGQWDQAMRTCDGPWSWTRDRLVKSLDLVEVHLRRRDYAEAERYLNRALELEPDSPAYIYQALLIVARDGDLARRLEVKEGIRQCRRRDIAFWLPQFDVGAALLRGWTAPRRRRWTGSALDRSARIRRGTISRRPGRAVPRRAGVPRGLLRFRGAGPGGEKPRPARRSHASCEARPSPTPASGRREPAIREGRRAVELRPPSKDTWFGVDMVRNLAVVYATLGEADSAVKQLRSCCSRFRRGSRCRCSGPIRRGIRFGAIRASRPAGRWGEARRRELPRAEVREAAFTGRAHA